jgi:GT2 family glycosyltransferase
MQCVTSVLEKSTYENYEILILENNSERQETFACYRQLETEEKVRILTCKTDWNYSYINNYGAEHAAGEYLLLLNNDTEVITPDWIQEMLSFALRPDVGAVGARLFYPDGTIQHAGVTLGIRGVAGHAFHGASGEAPGYQNRIITAQDLTAVTAACMMIPVEIFREVGGFDESYKVAFNDTDLCMRIRRGGYQVVYQPAAQLYHYESKSRGSDESNPEKLRRFNRESMQFQRQWCKEIYQGDPFYNPNLSIWNDDFTPIDTYRNMT